MTRNRAETFLGVMVRQKAEAKSAWEGGSTFHCSSITSLICLPVQLSLRQTQSFTHKVRCVRLALDTDETIISDPGSLGEGTYECIQKAYETTEHHLVYNTHKKLFLSFDRQRN